jgi:hypothetical protein
MSFLDRDRTIAKPGFSRWLIPPAALCVHLCIGQAYAFSVFNLPMTKLLGIAQSAPDDWALTDLGWIFSLAIFFLGASAALLGPRLQRRARGREGAGLQRDHVCDGGAAGGRLHLQLLRLGRARQVSHETAPSRGSSVREESMAQQPMQESQSNTLQLILAWGFVGIPLAWGIVRTVTNALKLFQ